MAKNFRGYIGKMGSGKTYQMVRVISQMDEDLTNPSRYLVVTSPCERELYEKALWYSLDLATFVTVEGDAVEKTNRDLMKMDIDQFDVIVIDGADGIMPEFFERIVKTPSIERVIFSFQDELSALAAIGQLRKGGIKGEVSYPVSA